MLCLHKVKKNAIISKFNRTGEHKITYNFNACNINLYHEINVFYSNFVFDLLFNFVTGYI